jgi:hypothetical protein
VLAYTIPLCFCDESIDDQQHQYDDDNCTSEQLWMQSVAVPPSKAPTVSAPAVSAFSTVKTEPVPAVTTPAVTSRSNSSSGGMQLGVKRGSMTLDECSLGGSAMSRPRKRLRNLVAPVLTKEREVCIAVLLQLLNCYSY